MVDRIRGVSQARAVNEALKTAVELIQRYGADDELLVQDPDDVFGRLDQARAQVRTAWDELQVALHGEDESTDELDTLGEQEMRVAFVEMITDAFADSLESLRQEGNVDVEVLADCLQSGIDMISTSAHSLDDFRWWDEDEQMDVVLPHEKAREALGYTVGETVA